MENKFTKIKQNEKRKTGKPKKPPNEKWKKYAVNKYEIKNNQTKLFTINIQILIMEIM